jgi:hypothetical protein
MGQVCRPLVRVTAASGREIVGVRADPDYPRIPRGIDGF